MLLNCGVGEDSWESLGLQGDLTSASKRKSVLNIHWKDWCWSWNCNTLATWCEELTHWKRPWCWERLKAGDGDDRGWDSWMASPTQSTWVWVNSGSWWWTGRPGMLQFMGLQSQNDWVTELNWTYLMRLFSSSVSAIRVVSSAYLRLLIFLPAILILACVSSSPVFPMIYSAYKLKKQVTIYNLDILLFLFGTTLLFHVQF